jgi:hypothetical protein
MTNKNYRRRVRSQRRTPPDLRKLSRALIALALAQAEADAQAEAQGTPKSETDRRRSA